MPHHLHSPICPLLCAVCAVCAIFSKSESTSFILLILKKYGIYVFISFTYKSTFSSCFQTISFIICNRIPSTRTFLKTCTVHIFIDGIRIENYKCKCRSYWCTSCCVYWYLNDSNESKLVQWSSTVNCNKIYSEKNVSTIDLFKFLSSSILCRPILAYNDPLPSPITTYTFYSKWQTHPPSHEPNTPV